MAIVLLEAGSILLAIGLMLFPMGIVYFKESWDDLKTFSFGKKFLAVMLEILDTLLAQTTASLSVLFLSVILIAAGCLFLLANLHLIHLREIGWVPGI
jgi:hypothetical protein